MKYVLMVLLILCAGCGLSGIRIDGTYEKDGQKFGGGTEWTFNQEKSDAEGSPVLEKDGVEYIVVPKKDAEAVIKYHAKTFPAPSAYVKALDWSGKVTLDFIKVCKYIREWLARENK